MEAHSELAKLLTEKELRDALLLIFANKQVLERSRGVRHRGSEVRHFTVSFW